MTTLICVGSLGYACICQKINSNLDIDQNNKCAVVFPVMVSEKITCKSSAIRLFQILPFFLPAFPSFPIKLTLQGV